MKSFKKAQGITLFGFIFGLAILGIFVYAGMQIGPVYMDHWNVKKAMNTVATEAGNASPSEIKKRLARLLDVSYVKQVNASEFKVIRGNGRELHVQYQVEKSFFYNLSFLMKFEETVQLN